MQINSPLKHPERRKELVNVLGDISRLKSVSSNYEIDEIYHFFFDDSSFKDSPLSEVGLTVIDSKEIAIVHALTLLLDELLNEVGDRETAIFVDHSNWSMVAELSKIALSVLEEAKL